MDECDKLQAPVTSYVEKSSYWIGDQMYHTASEDVVEKEKISVPSQN
jgi:hypothetical protein